MALEEDFYVRFKVADVRQRTVRRGEALCSIRSKPDEIPLWLFAKYNKNADLSTLMPGMHVRIPVIEEKTERDIALDPSRRSTSTRRSRSRPAGEQESRFSEYHNQFYIS